MTVLDRALPALILVATFVVFVPTLQFGFVYDDKLQILQDPYLLSWSYLPRYFTSNVWSFLPGFVSNYYRPLFFVWFRLNEALFGLRPAGWHLSTVLMHLVVTLEVYWVGVRLLADRSLAAVAAALFGLHPIHTESVAWVSGVTDPQVAALMLAALLAYLRSRDGGRRPGLWFAASLFLYGLAALSKETALVFPLLIFAFEWIWSRAPASEHPGQDRFRRFQSSLLMAIPYLGVTALYLFARWRALGALSSVMTPLPLRTLLLTWPSLLWFYAQKLLWPSWLSPHYDVPYVTAPGLRNFLFPAMMLVLIAGCLWLWARRKGKVGAPSGGLDESRLVAFFSIWLALPFLTLLNLSAFPLDEIAKDRYLYVPSIGAAWLAGLGWRQLRNWNSAAVGKNLKNLPIFVVMAACLTLGALTMRQTSYWASDLLLFSRAYEIAPDNPYALGNMALVAYQQGFPMAALKLFQRGVAVAPHDERLYYNMAVTEMSLGRLDDSDRDLSTAIRITPSDAGALLALGKLRGLEGRLADAAGLIREALQINPDGRGYHLALGVVLEKTGDLPGALNEFQAELAAHPDSKEATLAIQRVQKTTSP